MSTSRLPHIIYGTAWKADKTAALVVQAVNAGFRAIDTACQPKHYAQKEVGNALATLFGQGYTREELFIQTKFTPIEGQDPNRIPYDPDLSEPEQVLQSCEVSLEELGLEYIDGLLLHTAIFPYSRLLAVWRAMEQLHDAKKVLQLGISNCYELSTLKKLYDDARIKPTLLQNRFYDDSKYDIEIRSWAKEHALTYESFWTLTANPHLLAAIPLIQVASAHKLTPEQTLFNYLHQEGVVPLTGTTSPDHMQIDLHSFDHPFNDTEMDAIRTLIQSFADF